MRGSLIFVATILCYLPTLRAGFIWDDPDYVLNNHTLRTLDGLREMWLSPTSLPQWYPLVHTTFWIEYHLVGTSPLLYHIDNILLHALGAVLIWRLLAKLDVPGAFVAACVFAVHPVMVESVAWVTERKNVLSLVFYLLAMRTYLFGFAPSNQENTKPDWRAYALALVFFIAALFSKTVTASLPAAILLILWWKHGQLRLRDVRPVIPFFVVGLLMAGVTGYLERYHVGASGEITAELQLSLVQRCLIAGRAIWFYFGKLLFPHPLIFIYPRWIEIDTPSLVQWIFPLAVVLATVILFALRQRLGRGMLAGWLIFCGTLLPALGFVNVYPMRFSFVADHFQYHAAIAMIALIVACTWRLPERVRNFAWGAIIIVLGCLTFDQTRIYKNAEVLWRATAARNPNSWMVQTNLGNALAAQGRFDDAIPFYDRALELAPNLEDTRWNVGTALMRRGRVDDAETQLRLALEINPRFVPGMESLGELYFYHRNDPVTAVDFYRKALAIAPSHAKANYYYAVAIERQANDVKERATASKSQSDAQLWLAELNDAIEHYRTAVASDPDYGEAHYNLATCLMQLGQYDESIWNLREAVRINPNHAEAWTNLGNAFYQTRDFSNAMDAFTRALQINPALEPAQRGIKASRQKLMGI